LHERDPENTGLLGFVGIATTPSGSVLQAHGQLAKALAESRLVADSCSAVARAHPENTDWQRVVGIDNTVGHVLQSQRHCQGRWLSTSF